jgi:Zn-dependent metalloprotease
VPGILEPGDAATHVVNNADVSSNMEMVLQMEFTDSVIGHTHYLYRQEYLDLPIEGGEYMEHAQYGYVYLAHGRVIDSIPNSLEACMNSSAARDILLDSLDGDDFIWLHSDLEDTLKAITGDSTATYYPEGELLWALSDYDTLLPLMPGIWHRPAWKFRVISIQPSYDVDFYIDALNGNILKRITHRQDYGTATISHQGNRYIDTKWHGGFKQKYSLEADEGKDICTQKHENDYTFYKKSNRVFNESNAWGTTHQKATTAHWCVTKSWDYFKDRFGKHGMVSASTTLLVRYDATNTGNPGAFYDQSKSGQDAISFGYINGQYRAVIDVAGHEYTHGLMQNWIKPNYEKEPGAINESTADIFGFLVERYAQEGVSDWTVGEDAGALRNMANPHDFNHPKTYKSDSYWFPTENCAPSKSNDWCGVHTNSGVQNYWFHLLVEGGSGINGNNEPFQVVGLDVETSANIAWYYMRNFFTFYINYPIARSASTNAARLLYGECSQEHMQVENAWHAVGVGNRSSCAGNPDLGSPEILATTALLYPNPTANKLNFKFTDKLPRRIEIINIEGSKLLEIESDAALIEISLPNLAPGLYFAKVKAVGNIHTYRFVKL